MGQELVHLDKTSPPATPLFARHRCCSLLDRRPPVAALRPPLVFAFLQRLARTLRQDLRLLHASRCARHSLFGALDRVLNPVLEKVGDFLRLGLLYPIAYGRNISNYLMAD